MTMRNEKKRHFLLLRRLTFFDPPAVVFVLAAVLGRCRRPPPLLGPPLQLLHGQRLLAREGHPEHQRVLFVWIQGLK